MAVWLPMSRSLAEPDMAIVFILGRGRLAAVLNTNRRLSFSLSPLAPFLCQCTRALCASHGASRALVVYCRGRRVQVRRVACGGCGGWAKCGLPLDPVSNGFDSKPLSLSPRGAPGSGLCTGLRVLQRLWPLTGLLGWEANSIPLRLTTVLFQLWRASPLHHRPLLFSLDVSCWPTIAIGLRTSTLPPEGAG